MCGQRLSYSDSLTIGTFIVIQSYRKSRALIVTNQSLTMTRYNEDCGASENLHFDNRS